MNITVYELLGLIKDGKAPKKIKYYKNIYEYNQNDKRYHNIEPKRLDLSSKLGDYNFNYLNDEVEIIEEDKKIEFEDIKDIDNIFPIYNYFLIINKLIKNQKKLIEEIEKLKGKSE